MNILPKNLEPLGWNYFIIRGTKDTCYHDVSRYEAMVLQEVPCDAAIEQVQSMGSATPWFLCILIGVCVLVGIVKYKLERR
jgi:hypothetical protein